MSETSAQPDHLQNTVHISLDVRIGKAKHAVTQLLKGLVANEVSRAVAIKSVLHAVGFYDESPSPTLEVDDITRDRRLPAEVEAKLPQLAQADP